MRHGAWIALVLFPAVVMAATGASGRAAGQFRRADEDANGSLSRAEAERGAPALARHFDAIDVNGDGGITPYEIRAWRKSRRSASRTQGRGRFDEYFRRADADHDGVLSRAEVALSMPRMAGKFDRIDADRDGRLTLVEIHAWLDARRAARTGPPAARAAGLSN